MKISVNGTVPQPKYPVIMQAYNNPGFIVLMNENKSAFILKNGNSGYKDGDFIGNLCSNEKHWIPLIGEIVLSND